MKSLFPKKILLKKRSHFHYCVCLILSSAILTFSCSTEKAALNDHRSAKRIQKKYSEILGVHENAIKNIKLYSFIDTWMGTPYRYAGKNKNGVDCSGFAGVLLKEVFGKEISGSSASIHNQCAAVSQDELQEGDLIFFKTESKEVSHVGVYLQNNKFIHAAIKRGVVIDDLHETYYQKYYFGAGRLQ
jgi:lipoprotein Spr